jgi:TfoX/Sxy family transcriptional regulator of competence genes
MAFDEGLAQRIREQLGGTGGVAERRMFGGVSFMVDGNLCCGVIGDELIARVGPDATEAALRRPGSRLFDFTGRPMKGWVAVDSGALEADEALATWVQDALRFARSLPPK